MPRPKKENGRGGSILINYTNAFSSFPTTVVAILVHWIVMITMTFRHKRHEILYLSSRESINFQGIIFQTLFLIPRHSVPLSNITLQTLPFSSMFFVFLVNLSVVPTIPQATYFCRISVAPGSSATPSQPRAAL